MLNVMIVMVDSVLINAIANSIGEIIAVNREFLRNNTYAINAIANPLRKDLGMLARISIFQPKIKLIPIRETERKELPLTRLMTERITNGRIKRIKVAKGRHTLSGTPSL